MDNEIKSINHPCSELGFMIEAILSEKRNLSSPSQELTKARVAAALAGNVADAEKYLRIAVELADYGQPTGWTESLRAHYDLAVFLQNVGKVVESKRELSIVGLLLRTHFSQQFKGLNELKS